MAFKINKQAYTKLIEQDLEVLSKLPHSLELDHIKLVLTSSIDMYYPSDGSSQLSTESDCNMPRVSVSESDIKKMFPYEDIEEARPTRPLERIMKYNARQEDRREGARILLARIHSR